MLKKFALNAFALSGAFAASCSNSNGFQIAAQADMDALQDCTSVKGNVVITRDIPSLNVPNGISRIDGDFLVAQAISMTSLTAPSLETISGTFQLLNLTILSTLNLPKLSSASIVDWQTLPALRTYTTAITSAKSVSITDTRLEDLNGIKLESVGSLNINNNRYLKSLTLGSLKYASGAISIAFNSASASVDLSALVSAGNVSLNNVGDVSISALANVTGSFSFHQCSSQKYSAQNLTLIQESLSIIDNNALTEISMPLLTEVDGGFVIANNSALDNISGFPKLASVGGAFDVTGSFSKMNFSSLQDVRGDLNVQSSSKEFSCPLDNSDKTVQGRFTCQGAASSPTSLNGVKSSTSSTNSSSGSNKNGGVAISISKSTFSAAVVILSLLF